jgi:hypothetical protein
MMHMFRSARARRLSRASSRRSSATSSGTVRHPRAVRTRKGYALLAVLLVAILGAVLALAAAMLAMGNVVVQNASDRAAAVDDAALEGIEEARNRLNARVDTVPLTGYTTLEANATLAGGRVKRSTWVSRLGNSDSLGNAGEFGVQAEVVSKAEDALGNVAIRRAEFYQESFARYASFTDIGKGSNGSALWWALGAQAQGPVHSNDTIFVWNGNPKPQAVFHDKVTTAKIVLNKSAATFKKGPPLEKVARIPMPTSADLNIVKTIAAKAGYVFTPQLVTGDSANATMRIEFVAIDVNGDGNTTGPDEGYFRVYQQTSTTPWGAGYAVARTPVPPNIANLIPPNETQVVDSLLFSPNCGVVSTVGGRQAITQTFRAIPVATGANYRARMANKAAAYDNANARCFLGGDERLNANGIFQPVDSAGAWMPRTSGSVPAAVAARADGAYLWPLSPALNPNFRGVIFAEGRVAVSGTVRGRVTLASRSNLVIAHELIQATSPATTSGNCRADDDIVGLFSGEYVLYADNTLATPQNRRDNSATGAAWSATRKDFDPSIRRPDLAVHASMLALKSIGAELSTPPAGLPPGKYVARGTLRVIGGTIESRIGQTGSMTGSNLHGYNDDLSFNQCALSFPPPYFPTTNHWSRSQFFEVNPLGFTPGAWFSGR